ncbi:hypothetical protein F7725_023873 [Dissostichus mawsoni]|uniref:Splicing factor 3B subunit 5 n=17 Tax=Euteleosteomorpha TaxID=1489388 RepID=A0A7J5XXT2_DISMA|nr:hypothetical protein F7725_023873 [Dissostichus mawsoni]
MVSPPRLSEVEEHVVFSQPISEDHSTPQSMPLGNLTNQQRPETARMTDRYNIHSQLEHLQSKYIGTGHADTSKWEWLVNQHRDSYCSYMGHFDLLNYFSVAENESKARVRFNLMEKMLQPCGPPSDKPDDA